jgi:DNA primase
VTSSVPSGSMKVSLERATSTYETQMTKEAAQYLLGRGITKEVAASFRIGWTADDSTFPHRLSIPYLTPSGVVAMKFRAIDSSEPRFLTYTGTTMKRIYNSSVLSKPLTTVYLCEGEFDTITAQMCGLPAIGIPGVKQWKRTFSRALRNRRTVILADGDDSGEGRDFAETVAHDCEHAEIIIFEDMDVNSFYLKYGEEKLLKKVGVL